MSAEPYVTVFVISWRRMRTGEEGLKHSSDMKIDKERRPKEVRQQQNLTRTWNKDTKDEADIQLEHPGEWLGHQQR